MSYLPSEALIHAELVIATLMKVKSYEKIPSDHKPLSPEWQASMTDDDVVSSYSTRIDFVSYKPYAYR